MTTMTFISTTSSAANDVTTTTTSSSGSVPDVTVTTMTAFKYHVVEKDSSNYFDVEVILRNRGLKNTSDRLGLFQAEGNEEEQEQLNRKRS